MVDQVSGFGPVRRAYEAQTERMKVEQARRQQDTNEQIRVLEAQRKMRPMLDEAYQNFSDDPKQLSATLDDLFKAYTIETRRTVDPDVIKALKDPQFGLSILQRAKETNTPLGDILEQGAQPMLRAQARLALAKHASTHAAQEAAAGGSVLGPTDQPDTTVPPPTGQAVPLSPPPAQLGVGLTLPGITTPTQAAAAAPVLAPSPAAAPAARPPLTAPQQPVGETPTPAPAAAAESPTTPALPSPVAPPGGPTPALQAAVDQVDKTIRDLEARKAIMIRKNADARLITPLQQSIDTLAAHRRELTDKFALGQATAAAQQARTPLPPEVLKETGLPVGSTYGDLAAMPQRPKLLSPAQSAGVQAGARSAGTEFDNIVHQGTVSRQTRALTDIATQAALRTGVTGPWVTPVRESLFNLANLFGIKPKGQTAMQLLDAITPQMAVQLTSQMKGQQSDREFLAGVQSAINKGQTQQAFALVAFMSREMADRAIEKEIQARRWIANPNHPGINLPDEYGKTFQERFDDMLSRQDARQGTIGQRAASAFGINYNDVLKGNITLAPRNPAGSAGGK